MKARLLVAVVSFALAAPRPAAAQALRASTWTFAPRPWSASSAPQLGFAPFGAAARPARSPLAIDTAAIPKTHWKAGGLIGAGVLGVLTAAIGVGLCGLDSPCDEPVLPALGGFAIGAVTGFGLGALIGGQFPQRPR